jgi:tetratricopeptide (TPR) repeat protein
VAALVMMVVAALLWTAPAAAAADRKTTDLQARKAFAAGEYQKALDLFADLYAETQHPTYLRNIGRCHQNLGDPDKAIAAFRDYLRKAKNLTPEQQAETDKFIAEMEELKRRNAAAAAAKAQPPLPAATAPAASKAAESDGARSGDESAKKTAFADRFAAPSPAGQDRQPALVGASAARETDQPAPFYTRFWFWAGVGAVAIGTVVAILIVGADRGPDCGSLGCGDLTGKSP